MKDAALVQPGSQAARGPINGNMQRRKRRAGFKEKIIMSSAFNILSSLCPWGNW